MKRQYRHIPAESPGLGIKLTIFLAALLVVFTTPSFSIESIHLTNQGNGGGQVYQTLNIDNAKNVANIDTFAECRSWSSSSSSSSSGSSSSSWHSSGCSGSSSTTGSSGSAWSSSWDYNTGYMAVRYFPQKVCYVYKMNTDVVPNLQELARLAMQKQDNNVPVQAPPQSLQYMVSSTRVDNNGQYGKSIEALCEGVPSFLIHQVQGNAFFVQDGCANVGLLGILGINVCGDISS